MIAYILQMASFIMLRVRFSKIDRPYRALRIAGAAVAAAIAGVTLVTLFLNPDYSRSVSGAAMAWFVRHRVL